MELKVCDERNNTDKSYVVNKMIEFNLKHFPDDLKGRYEVVNLYLKDVDGNIYGGLVGETKKRTRLMDNHWTT
ncbi:putative N-acetyltransferase [Paenibacillus agaridevorans]|uniref:Putative N-acetyltransferase n=1 Tax=Paenibacillus agaridevorans TaxID=171404 RepID=A0A2R5ETV2_9BACL|nr:hypothetical protein [Paenibacillus agaridevorans]GBG07213.1 putative N-acetyltransferase [Paenibacillus agaridevorans]